MKQLIEDYQRRLKSVTDMLAKFKSTGSIYDAETNARLNTKASEYRTIIADLERFGAPEFIKNIDFSALKTQKTTLIEEIADMRKRNAEYYEPTINDFEGILALIDALQDYAVDEMGIDEKQVFDLEDETCTDGLQIPSYIVPKEETIKVWCCAKCGSTHVEEKHWVNLNTNEVTDDNDEPHGYWCADCGELVDVFQDSIKADAKIIGYQVVADPNGGEEGKRHPDIPSDDIVFTLERAHKIINNSLISSDWQLLAVWSDDVENPVFWQD